MNMGSGGVRKVERGVTIGYSGGRGSGMGVTKGDGLVKKNYER